MKLSIITVNYNDAEGLERTIMSVISQSFKDFEFIVIDGGSTDASVDVIKKYEDNIDYWVEDNDPTLTEIHLKNLNYSLWIKVDEKTFRKNYLKYKEK